jgi:hypothetical protein
MWRFDPFITLAAITAILSGTRALAQPTNSVADLVFPEPVRIAFYEPAPKALATSMRNAVQQRCGVFARSSSSAPSWYCSAVDLRFFRQVNVLGTRYKTGLACAEDSVTVRFRRVRREIEASLDQ